MSDFYRRLDEATRMGPGVTKLLKERPENLHDYQGCAADTDKEKGVQLLDAFIARVNSDHEDTITIPRNIACLMRDEIQRLRKK